MPLLPPPGSRLRECPPKILWAPLRSDGDWRSVKGRGERADLTREWQQAGQQVGPRQGPAQQPHRDQKVLRLPRLVLSGTRPGRPKANKKPTKQTRSASQWSVSDV